MNVDKDKGIKCFIDFAQSLNKNKSPIQETAFLVQSLLSNMPDAQLYGPPNSRLSLLY